MRAQHFGGVDSAIDPNHRLAFVRQGVRLIVGETFGMRELLRDLLVMVQLLLILG